MPIKDKNENNFSSHAIGEKKTAVKKTGKKIATKKITSLESDNKVVAVKMKKIEKELKEIYEDNNGNIPNMKNIEKRKKHPVLKAIFATLFIGSLMSAIAWVGFYYLPQQKEIGKNNVTFEIKGPTELKISATSTYIVNWKNNENVTINNAVITINYPDGFFFAESSIEPSNVANNEWDLGNLAPGESGTLKITGQTFGTIDQEKSWRVFLNYTPENFQSELQKTSTLITKITRSPIDLSIIGPEKATAGDEVEYIISINNEDKKPIDKLIIALDLPSSFNITDSEPKIEKNNFWTISQASNTSTENDLSNLKFLIRGKYNNLDTANESNLANLSVNANLVYGPDNQIFNIATTNLNTEVVKSNVALTLAINGAMSNFGSQPGDILNATLNLKNNSQENIKNAQIKIIFEAPSLNRRSSLNWAKLEDVLDGNIIGEQISDTIRRGTITWTSKHSKKLTELKPGEEISLDFRLPILTTDAFDFSAIKENHIRVINESTYTNSQGVEEAITGKELLITLNSDLKLEVRSVKNDQTYNISWILTNNYHSLKDLELSATLFGDSTFEVGENIPAGQVDFKETDKKISWTIPSMPEAIDVLAMPFSITLNKQDPTQNTLISKVRVKATDVDTGETIEFMSDEVPIMQ